MEIESAVAEYQCPGCMMGSDSKCGSFNLKNGCSSHLPGTFSFGIGKIFLGMPRGFNRLGPMEDGKLEIYKSYEDLINKAPNLTTIFSVPVWMHLDDHGNTIMRWFSPRTNCGWSLVILGDQREHFKNVIEISKEDIDNMD